ncbi:hypothetical protein ACIBQX_11780 [Nonomuraea sp. NPDC049714]|uniref:DUF6197 family protein n=1 Tax=Nonomuraea sp. NPDC049714 TaxID=3364357 RepID=UPI0037A00B35
MTPENILNAARGVLKQRGRCIGQFKTEDGRVDLPGALAIADGAEADMWLFWRGFEFEELDTNTRAVIEAARLLAEVMAPLQPVRTMSLNQLVALLGDASDTLSGTQIDDFLKQAASLAAQRGIAA